MGCIRTFETPCTVGCGGGGAGQEGGVAGPGGAAWQQEGPLRLLATSRCLGDALGAAELRLVLLVHRVYHKF